MNVTLMGMAAHALASASTPSPRRRSARAETEPAGRLRLDVIATSVPDVVRRAGGWLADRALAGWDVNVFVPDTDDAAPLRILGVSAHPITETGERLAAELTGGVAELTVWAADAPGDMADRFHPVEHTLSIAARAFKSHALRAAGIADEWEQSTEVFHYGARS